MCTIYRLDVVVLLATSRSDNISKVVPVVLYETEHADPKVKQARSLGVEDLSCLKYIKKIKRISGIFVYIHMICRESVAGFFLVSYPG